MLLTWLFVDYHTLGHGPFHVVVLNMFFTLADMMFRLLRCSS